RPLIPPPVVIVQPVVVRPRIAVLDFIVKGHPLKTPPWLGPWTAQHLAPYFTPYYDVVDAGTVYWYMGRMGLTLRDLKEDPYARRWLGRALGVRYFVFGAVVQTGSFDVTTYMVDAEYGYLYGSARLKHVNSPFELKLRLDDLARFTVMDPFERNRLLAQEAKFQALVAKGRFALDRRDYGSAILLFEDALRLRPGNAEVLVYLHQARHQAHLAALEDARRKQFSLQLVINIGGRQWALAHEAELARIQAAKAAASMAEKERRLQAEKRRQAQLQLASQARVAVKMKNFQLAISMFESALGFGPSDDIVRELAFARAEATKAAQLKAAQWQAIHEAGLRKQKELELAKVKAELEA